MAVRELRYFGDPVLKTVCDPVTRFDKTIESLVTDLLDTVQLPGRAGLAAPQIGVSLRVFSYNVEGLTGYVINPEIAELSEETREFEEGCLSIPQIWLPTVRSTRALVRGVDVDNNPIEVEGTGVLAQALQHETDHLDGKLYLDRLTPERKKQAMRQARDKDWFWKRD
jgi:peptide deformylase